MFPPDPGRVKHQSMKRYSRVIGKSPVAFLASSLLYLSAFDVYIWSHM